MSDYNRSGRKRLSVDIPKEVYMDIRRLAGERNCTITKLVIRALIKEITKEAEQLYDIKTELD